VAGEIIYEDARFCLWSTTLSGDFQRRRRLLGGLGVGIFYQAVTHVPVETAQAMHGKWRGISMRIAAWPSAEDQPSVSPKRSRLEGELPIIAVPTTFAGSK
jgi:hypothetical protein